MRLTNLSLARKLALGFGAVLVIVAASAIFLLFKTSTLKETERLNSVSDTAIDLIDQVNGDLAEMRSGIRKFVLTGAAADSKRLRGAVDKEEHHLAAAKEIFAKEAPQFLADVSALQGVLDVYLKDGLYEEERLAANPTTRPQAVAMITTNSTGAMSEAVHAASDGLRDKVNVWSTSWTLAGNRQMNSIVYIVLATGLLTILMGVAMAWVIVQAVGGPLTAMTKAMSHLAAGDTSVAVPALGQQDEIGAMAAAVQTFKNAAIEKVRLEADAAAKARDIETERAHNEAQKAAAAAEQARVVATIADGLDRLARGNLSHKIEASFPADYERLRVDFNAAMTNLLSTMVVVAQNTSAISNGTKEIATASDDLSLRTEQQAASLEQTAAALAQLTEMVNKTSAGARNAHDLVIAAQSQAEASSEVVTQAVSAITDISRSSTQIGQIIGVIDEIAFQTNLLALNAGVEAARAGESGRGFAVVASEVRALAQRSAEAAKEIKVLITASSGLVEQGVDLVGRTGQALSEIQTSVSRITSVVADISQAAREQATGLAEINTAISQMDKVTQQNAAMVEEATAATHSLAGETADLVGAIENFDLGDSRRQSAPVVLATKRNEKRPRPAQPAVRKVVNGSYTPSSNADEDWTEF